MFCHCRAKRPLNHDPNRNGAAMMEAMTEKTPRLGDASGEARTVVVILLFIMHFDVSAFPLFMSQRFNGMQNRRFAGRYDSKHHSRSGRKAQGQRHRP